MNQRLSFASLTFFFKCCSMGSLLLYCGAAETNSSPLRKNFSFKGLRFVFTGLVKVEPFHLPCMGQILSSTCPAYPRHPSLIKESLLPWENCAKFGLHVHTNFALPLTVNKGSSQLCPLFILIVTVHYEQNYIPKLISHRLKKSLLSTAQPLLGLSLAEVRGAMLLHSITEALAHGHRGNGFSEVVL